MNYLGLDAHSANFTLAHLNERGRLCQMYDRPTSAKDLIEVVQRIRGPKTLVTEECHLAQWVKHVLEPHVDELIICDPRRNRWIAADEYADDASSARKLAELLRGGYIKPIAHPDDFHADRRALFLHYYAINHQGAKVKIQLKAVFRQVALRTRGRLIYKPDDRQEWLAMLEGFPALQLRASTYFDLMDVCEDKKQLIFGKLCMAVRSDPVFERLQTVPGVGPVIAAGYIALIETPHRFSRRNKLWAYAGLGVKRHDSDDRTYTNRGSRTGCRPLKWLVMQQFNSAVSRARSLNRFKQLHQRLLADGTSGKAARRQVCRSMLSTIRSIWITGEPYREMN